MAPVTDETADSPPARRPGGRNARVRSQILAATAELVARDGAAGFRYEDVAERAGVHRASVYRHWPDREDLVIEAVLHHADELATIADTGDIHRDLVDFLQAMAQALQSPFGRALEQELYRSSAQALTKILDQRVTAMRRRVQAAVERAELPPVDSGFLGEMLSGPVHLIVNRGIRSFTRRDAERIVAVVLAGIRSGAPADQTS
ncbi:TetR/AcrR family transcriptional regulator [Mycolicibacterium bacteremicum]|uniref:TetR/AcrR family transcriptional regulator n=1 Tax=Mycolicibacterium bacteremicum TaxID=564198 RepID=UPI0026EC3732|nr:TetR/AcrR family transcriptional regulator [Mycolicibacterium bacteremicum]